MPTSDPLISTDRPTRRAASAVSRPPRLRPGDLVGVVAPASPIADHSRIERGVAYLEGRGYRVRLGEHVRSVHGYLAGRDADRAADLNACFRDPEVRAIFCLRGGYGTPRLLPLVDYKAARRDPKIFVGYSDTTALQLALWRRAGLATFSGPMVGVEMHDGFDPYSEDHLWRLLTDPTPAPLDNPDGRPLVVHRPGTARGRLLGGNLALLVTLVGTPYLPNVAGTVVAFEEIGEEPYRFDRLLAQLRLSGTLARAAAVVVGELTDCVPSDLSKPTLELAEILDDHLLGAGSGTGPVVSGLVYGHIPRKLTLPIGAEVELTAPADGAPATLRLAEGAVV